MSKRGTLNLVQAGQATEVRVEVNYPILSVFKDNEVLVVMSLAGTNPLFVRLRHRNWGTEADWWPTLSHWCRFLAVRAAWTQRSCRPWRVDSLLTRLWAAPYRHCGFGDWETICVGRLSQRSHIQPEHQKWGSCEGLSLSNKVCTTLYLLSQPHQFSSERFLVVTNLGLGFHKSNWCCCGVQCHSY